MGSQKQHQKRKQAHEQAGQTDPQGAQPTLTQSPARQDQAGHSDTETGRTPNEDAFDVDNIGQR